MTYTYEYMYFGLYVRSRFDCETIFSWITIFNCARGVFGSQNQNEKRLSYFHVFLSNCFVFFNMIFYLLLCDLCRLYCSLHVDASAFLISPAQGHKP